MLKCRGNFKNTRASEQGNLSHMSTTSIENIKQACMKHFGLSMDGLLCCDVLAGEQVPSCSSVKRLADFKVIHVRFVERSDYKFEPEAKLSRKSMASTRKTTVTGQQAVAPRKFLPKSLCLVEMLELGKVIYQRSIHSTFLLHVSIYPYTTSGKILFW